jgi:hypothetical protein
MDRTVPTRKGPSPGGQRWDEFDFFKFGPPRTVQCGPCGTVNRPNPWTVRVWTGPDRHGPFAKYYLNREQLSA